MGLIKACGGKIRKPDETHFYSSYLSVSVPSPLSFSLVGFLSFHVPGRKMRLPFALSCSRDVLRVPQWLMPQGLGTT